MKSNFIVYDFETCTKDGRNPYVTQPSQLAALAIDFNSLEVIPGAEFNSLMKPVGEFEWDMEALAYTKKTKEEVEAAPHPKQVWGDFVEFTKRYRVGKTKWGNPIPVGHNSDGFDSIIANRLIEQYGPMKDSRPALWNPQWSFDTMRLSFLWLHNIPEVESFSQPTLMEFFGADQSLINNAHDALADVKMTALQICRYMALFRRLSKQIKFQGAFSRNA